MGGGGGRPRDAVSIRLHVDLDIVRMLDVLHQSPGRAEAGLARGADIIAWFCVWAGEEEGDC